MVSPLALCHNFFFPSLLPPLSQYNCNPAQHCITVPDNLNNLSIIPDNLNNLSITAQSQYSLTPKTTQMDNTSDTKMTKTQNPHNIFADLFTQTHPNIIWTICCSPLYPKTFEANKAYFTLINYTNEFLSNIKAGLQCLYNTNTINKKATKSLNTLVTSQIKTINSQAKTITILK